MGRSGTSALTRMLALCGGGLPAELLGATQGNPLGHWEPREALDLNETFLSGNGATWYDPTLRLQGEITFGNEQATAYIQQIQAFLRSLKAAPFVVIKEPRITMLSDFWLQAARAAGVRVGVAVAIRHPEEAAASLAARDRTTSELSHALWLKSNLLAERQSRTLPRVFVDYANLMRDWRRETARIASALSVDLSVRDEAAIDEFLRQDLRRQVHDDAICDVFGAPWISRVYAALSAAARDESPDTLLLDEIYDSFRASERAFRVALDDYRTRFGPVEAKRLPNIARLIYAVAGRDSPLLRSQLTSQWYIERNPDIVAAGQDPYEHWLRCGMDEGRLPCDDPLALLDRFMQERMSRPASPTSTPATASAPATAVRDRSPPAAAAEPARIRVICATRRDREAFYSETALGRSLSLHRPAAVELRVFASNTQGLASVYNTAIAESVGEREILLFIHDDVHLCDFHWADRLRAGLGAFDVVGLAGNRRRLPGQPGWGLMDEKLTGDNRENFSGTVAHGRGFPPDSIDVFGPSSQRVALLDGLFLAVRSETLQAKSLHFDERFDFHFYDLDFCRQAERAGLTMGTWPIAVVHESKGGYVSDSWRRGYDAYLQKWGN
ncbi:MAG: glycosyltransferase [Steroidobacteraceae bacterium]